MILLAPYLEREIQAVKKGDRMLCKAPDGGWNYVGPDGAPAVSLGIPIVEIDGKAVALCVGAVMDIGEAREVFPGVVEHRVGGEVLGERDLHLEMIFRTCAESPVVRFRYVLRSGHPRRLTKVSGRDNLRYVAFRVGRGAKEVRLSSFNEQVHSFVLAECPVRDVDFEAERKLMGPLLCWESDGAAKLVAYEHGSQVPDAFVSFALSSDGSVSLVAEKGNYTDGQALTPERPYETIWFDVASVASGGESALAEAFRYFVLRWMSPNAESRKPYVFYNTWNFQERNKWWNRKAYLADMNEARMLEEIDVAHRMGVEVFVMDTGWFEKTGDWQVSTQRFPNGLAPIKARLDAWGMKLGLWFNPIIAAVSSQMHARHADCLMSEGGKIAEAREVWETPASQGICLVSRYGEAFADELIRLNREMGVTYFKWDAIGQYGCDSPDHDHGNVSNTPEERRQAYAFQLVSSMGKVVDKLCAACPEAIVDFDITEGGRCVGLAFLASGKYFLINNGPYFGNLDHPHGWDTQGTSGMGVNVFVYPGAARTWVCRTPLSFDKWIPSVLFLTHYLPDDPAESQVLCVASLILGQNGIWGDLPAVSDDGVRRISSLLAHYVNVRDDITAASPCRTGDVATSPEVHEKINPVNGRGAIVIFAASGGTFCYATQHVVSPDFFATAGVDVQRLASGQALIRVTLEPRASAIVFFGTK